MLTLPMKIFCQVTSNNSGIKQSEKDSYSSCQADCLSPMLSTDKACRGNLLILTFMFTVQKEDIYVVPGKELVVLKASIRMFENECGKLGQQPYAPFCK